MDEDSLKPSRNEIDDIDIACYESGRSLQVLYMYVIGQLNFKIVVSHSLKRNAKANRLHYYYHYLNFANQMRKRSLLFDTIKE